LTICAILPISQDTGGFKMSSVSSIGSLISSILSLQSSSTNNATAQASTSDASSTDTVSLSQEAQNQLKLLLETLSQGSTGSNNYISELLSGSQSSNDSDSSMYSVLLSAENAQLMKNNPTLVKMITSVDQAGSTDSTSTGTSSIEDIDLMNMSVSDLLSIIKKYNALSGTTTATSGTASSSLDETV
jgi:hypothetical protein